MTIKEIERSYRLDHTARARGYISRKSEGLAVPYKGRFGAGYKVYRPAWDSSRYCYVDYYLK